MRLNIDIRKKFNLGSVNLKLTKELNEAGRIIRKDHVTRLERGMGVDGNRMQELADATIEAKGFDQILVNTGKMRNLVIERATAKKQEVILYPGRKEKRGKVTNQQIGGFHQHGKKVPKREWFGISQDAEKKAMRAIELKIDRVLRNA